MKIQLNQLDEIISQHYDEIFSYCRMRINSNEDVYDITQEIFLALIAQYNTVDCAKVRKWLYCVAHNHVVDYYKLNKKRQDLIDRLEVSYDAYDELFSDFDDLSDKDVAKYRAAILGQLTENEQILYREIYREHKSYSELSEQYQVSEATLRKRVSRLCYKIRSLVKTILYLCLHLAKIN